MGLLALMLLHESRRAARTSPTATWSCWTTRTARCWNREQIAEGAALVERALASRRFGPYTLQAAIAAVHAEAPSAAATDWAQIVGLYDVLARRTVAGRRAQPRRVASGLTDCQTSGPWSGSQEPSWVSRAACPS